MIKPLKNSKGVTLISLIVSIIILCILAGVSWKELTSNNIAKSSEDAKNQVLKLNDNTEAQREDVYDKIVENKTAESVPTIGSVNITVQKPTDTSVRAETSGISNAESYTFYIKKSTENDSAYVVMPKNNKLDKNATITGLEKSTTYTVRVVAKNNSGLSTKTETNIAL